MEENRKVKAIWIHTVYSTSEYSGDPDDPIGFSEYDEQETRKLENAVQTKEYDSIDEALRDFLSSNVTDLEDNVFIDETTITDESKMQISIVDCHIYIEHQNLKKEDEKFVRLSDEEFESRFNGDTQFQIYNFRDQLRVQYLDGSSADKDVRKVYRKNYEELCTNTVPAERQRILGEMRKEFSE